MTRLYLDFDGVLHRFRAAPDQEAMLRDGLYRVCKDGEKVFWTDTHFEHVEALAKTLEPFPEVEIYGHTSWRHLWHEQRPQDVVDWLGPLGPRFKRFIPNYIKGTRYDVVRVDMYHDKYKGPWVAIDDIDDGFSIEPDNFIHTDKDVGLTSEDLDTLIQKLCVERDILARGQVAIRCKGMVAYRCKKEPVEIDILPHNGNWFGKVYVGEGLLEEVTGESPEEAFSLALSSLKPLKSSLNLLLRDV